MSRKPRTVRGRNERARGRSKSSSGRARPQPSAAERAGDRKRPAARSPRRDDAIARPRRDASRPRPNHEEQSAPAIDPALLHAALSQRDPLRSGEWLWTMREGAERDLIEELLLRDREARPRKLAPALVASARAPIDGDSRLDVTFARQAFRVEEVARAGSIEALASALSMAIARRLQDTPRYALQLFVPDSELGNPLAGHAEQLETLLVLPTSSERVPDSELRRHGGLLVQICLFANDAAAIGGIPSDRALSLWPGGRARMRLVGEVPSRAARKLAEAFAWLGMAPSSGELCVDLGAAPGGWSWLLLEKRARVIAVDPAKMNPKLMANPKLSHVQGSAFDFSPDEPVDWLFCDMVWRPQEVAQMLGRWGRRRQTRTLVANFKLPMKRKIETVLQVRALLEASGYSAIRTRQLYHDRDEITLTAHVR